jgi:hypothetical protein
MTEINGAPAACDAERIAVLAATYSRIHGSDKDGTAFADQPQTRTVRCGHCRHYLRGRHPRPCCHCGAVPLRCKTTAPDAERVRQLCRDAGMSDEELDRNLGLSCIGEAVGA